MRVEICNDYDDMSTKAARILAGQIILKPNCVLGLATGSTPIGMYEKLVEMNKEGKIDFSEVKTFNLDEYYPMKKSNRQSYDYFMNEHLFLKVNINKKNIHIPNGETNNPQLECENYDKAINDCGGIDLQVLGIGQNGHIGFNEPSGALDSFTHLTKLSTNTTKANSRFFGKDEVMPDMALTMGIATILSAKKIILLASGVSKRKAVSELLNDEINTHIPASLLKTHPDVTLLCDKDAYGKEL